MLFDLWLDPVERVNLVRDSAYMEVYNDLSKRLLSWMERTYDPLLYLTAGSSLFSKIFTKIEIPVKTDFRRHLP